MLLDIAIILLLYLLIKRFVFKKSICNMAGNTVKLAIVEVILIILGLAGLWIGFVGAFKEFSELIPQISLVVGVLSILFAMHVAKRLHEVSR